MLTGRLILGESGALQAFRIVRAYSLNLPGQ